MKKKSTIITTAIIASAIVYVYGAQYLRFNVNDFSKGINTYTSETKLQRGFTPKAYNVKNEGGSIEVRNGYVNISSNSVDKSWVWNAANGNEYVYEQDGTNLYYRTDYSTRTLLKDDIIATPYLLNATIHDNKIWFTNPINGVFSHNGLGNRMEEYDFIPKGKYIESSNSRLFVAGEFGYESRVYYSAISWVKPTDKEDAWNTGIQTKSFGSNDGDIITGLKEINSGVCVFKSNSLWMLEGYGLGGWAKNKISNKYGFPSEDATAYYSGGIIGLSQNGTIVITDGSQVQEVSAVINNNLKDIINLAGEMKYRRCGIEEEFNTSDTVENLDISNVVELGKYDEDWNSSNFDDGEFDNTTSSSGYIVPAQDGTIGETRVDTRDKFGFATTIGGLGMYNNTELVDDGDWNTPATHKGNGTNLTFNTKATIDIDPAQKVSKVVLKIKPMVQFDFYRKYKTNDWKKSEYARLYKLQLYSIGIKLYSKISARKKDATSFDTIATTRIDSCPFNKKYSKTGWKKEKEAWWSNKAKAQVWFDYDNLNYTKTVTKTVKFPLVKGQLAERKEIKIEWWDSIDSSPSKHWGDGYVSHHCQDDSFNVDYRNIPKIYEIAVYYSDDTPAFYTDATYISTSIVSSIYPSSSTVWGEMEVDDEYNDYEKYNSSITYFTNSCLDDVWEGWKRVDIDTNTSTGQVMSSVGTSIKWKAHFQSAVPTAIAKLNSVNIVGRASTGTLITEPIKTVPLYKRLYFVASEDKEDGGDISYYWRQSTGSVAISSVAWETGSVLTNLQPHTDTDKPWIQFRFIMTPSTTGVSPAVNSILTTWLPETERVPATAMLKDNSFYLAVSTSYSYNNMEYVLDKNGAFWEYRDRIIGDYYQNGDDFYFTNSSGIYKISSEYTDNGNAISWYYETPSVAMSQENKPVEMHYVDIMALKSGHEMELEWSSIDTNANRGISYSSATVFLYGDGILSERVWTQQMDIGKVFKFRLSGDTTNYIRIDSMSPYYKERPWKE